MPGDDGGLGERRDAQAAPDGQGGGLGTHAASLRRDDLVHPALAVPSRSCIPATRAP